MLQSASDRMQQLLVLYFKVRASSVLTVFNN